MWPFSGSDADAAVHVVTEGDPDWTEPAARAVVAGIEDHYRATVRVGDPQGLHDRVGLLSPESPHDRCHDADRDQYDAGELAAVGVELLDSDGAVPVLLTDRDLFAERRTYVLGVTLLEPEPALVLSLARLWDDDRRFTAVELDRVRKEAVKLYGWSLGGERCADPDCVLSETSTVRDLDAQDERICGRSRREIGEERLR